MLKKDVKVGSVYMMKVSGKVVPVKIVAENPETYRRHTGRMQFGGWKGLNLRTFREVHIKSAAKLRREVARDVEPAISSERFDRAYHPDPSHLTQVEQALGLHYDEPTSRSTESSPPDAALASRCVPHAEEPPVIKVTHQPAVSFDVEMEDRKFTLTITPDDMCYLLMEWEASYSEGGDAESGPSLHTEWHPKIVGQGMGVAPHDAQVIDAIRHYLAEEKVPY